MWYFVLYAVLAAWVFVDAGRRLNHRVGWPAATLVIGPLVLPVYFAKRNLKEGEVREGGTGWNVLKNFALLWTLTMFVAGIAGFVGVAETIDPSASDAELAGAAIGGGIGLGLIGLLWFIVAISALVIGLFLKKSTFVEKGPSGALAVKGATED